MSSGTISESDSTAIPVLSGETVVLSNASRSRASIEFGGKFVNPYHAGHRQYGPFNAGDVTLGAVVGDVDFEVLPAGTTFKAGAPVTVTLLTGTATYNPPSLIDGVGAGTTVTVSGADTGDAVAVTFSLSLQAIALTAAVTGTDTVTVWFQNGTGGTLNLASGTLTATVVKQ